jgi:hypothetical protein
MMTKKASNHNGVGIFNGCAYTYSASDEKYDIIAIKDDGHEFNGCEGMVAAGERSRGTQQQ